MSSDKQVLVVGSGLMGTGIAVQFARGGYSVHCYDPYPKRLEQSAAMARAVIVERIVEGPNKDSEVSAILDRITYASDWVEHAGTGLVIEAGPEKLELKRQIYSDLERVVPANVIIASNTSGFLPDELSASMQRPSRFMIAHFWNPPDKIPLVELVPCFATETECLSQMETLLKDLDFEPVILSRALPGFIGNRLQFAVLREALHILREGVATVETIDKVMTASLGRRYAKIGPFAAADLGGLDTILDIATYLMPQLAKDEDVLDLLRERVERGAIGSRSGMGFYASSVNVHGGKTGL